MRNSLILFIILIMPSSSFSNELNGTDSFKAGLTAYEEGDFTEAAKRFNDAYVSLPVIGDYSLYYLSMALYEKGDTKDSSENIERLLNKYPLSPLRKNAARLFIKNLSKDDRDKAIEKLWVFTRENPQDKEMKYLLACLLEINELGRNAQPLYRELYLTAGEFSEKAFERLKVRDFSVEELLLRADRLSANANHKEAEKTLRDALNKSEGNTKKAVLQKLGLSLFNQKEYTKSAKISLEADDLYYAAKAFLRASDTDSFDKTLDGLIAKKDQRASDLLVSKAVEKYDEGKTDDALKALSKATELFPSNSEKALWQTGWIYFKEKKFDKSADIFSKLCASGKSGRYLYWKARSLEKSGGDAEAIYKEITDGSYYDTIARLRRGQIESGHVAEKPKQNGHLRMRRIDTLAAVGLFNDAASELEKIAEKLKRNEGILKVAYKLVEIRQYNKAIAVASKLPEDMRPNEILYPLAYWQEVNKVSEDYGLDPFLILSLMREESRYNAGVVSPAGAIGLMQLMPNTASKIGRSIDINISGNGEIFDIDKNIKIGAYYLRNLINEFNSVSATLAAYNAGEDRVRKWLKSGGYESFDDFIEDVPYDETRNYIKRIITTYYRYRLYAHPQYSLGSPAL